MYNAHIKEEIEQRLAEGLRTYCRRRGVANRFRKIPFETLDFSALGKHLAHHGLEVDCKSRKELEGLRQYCQNLNRIESLFTDLLSSITEGL